MPPMSGIHLSDEDRWKIIFLRRQGFTQASISRQTGHGKAAVRRWAGEAKKKRASVTDRPRTGRPPKFGAADKRWIRRAFTPAVHAGEVARHFTKARGLGISRPTIAKIWKKPSLKTSELTLSWLLKDILQTNPTLCLTLLATSSTFVYSLTPNSD